MSAVVELPAAQTPGDPPTPSAWRRFFHPNNRFLPPILITCILMGAEFGFGVLESGSRTLLAIITCISVEMLVGRWVRGKWPNAASAYISGISIGMLVRSPFFWPYALCAAITILSKYVVRWRGHHLWNPSNFGVSVLFFLYPDVAASLSIQWGNSVWPMLVVWAIGILIIGRLKRFHITATYVVSFCLLSWLRSLMTGNPFWASVAPLTGPMYQLYVFFMITDPPTTVRSKLGQCVVVFLVAVVEMILRLNQEVHAPYYALFIVGPIAMVIDLARRGRPTTRVAAGVNPAAAA